MIDWMPLRYFSAWLLRVLGYPVYRGGRVERFMGTEIYIGVKGDSLLDESNIR